MQRLWRYAYLSGLKDGSLILCVDEMDNTSLIRTLYLIYIHTHAYTQERGVLIMS